VSEPDGQIHSPGEKGLYFFDTRVISSWTIYANGEPWELLNGGAIAHMPRESILRIEGFSPRMVSFRHAHLVSLSAG